MHVRELRDGRCGSAKARDSPWAERAMQRPAAVVMMPPGRGAQLVQDHRLGALGAAALTSADCGRARTARDHARDGPLPRRCQDPVQAGARSVRCSLSRHRLITRCCTGSDILVHSQDIAIPIGARGPDPIDRGCPRRHPPVGHPAHLARHRQPPHPPRRLPTHRHRHRLDPRARTRDRRAHRRAPAPAHRPRCRPRPPHRRRRRRSALGSSQICVGRRHQDPAVAPSIQTQLPWADFNT